MKVEITCYKSGKRAGSIKKKEIRIDYYDNEGLKQLFTK